VSAAPQNPILITGGSSGIGAATARLAANSGLPVAISYRTGRTGAEALVAELRAEGREAFAFQADVAQEADIVRLFAQVDAAFGGRRLFAQVDAAFGGRRLAGLVNSAGISGPHGPVTAFNGENLAHLWAVNVTGTILASREAVRRFRARGGGAIVNVSSMAATIGGRGGAAAYAASKAAVDAFTRGLAKEVAAEGIRVNAVRPGFTLTPMTAQPPEVQAAVALTLPIQRAARPEEVARPILWLLSAEASFVTGARLDVSGGGFLVPGILAPAAAGTEAP
jgi:NAD(P)-dependent dehydrogenase (short-subunit alcohol dehydrogenase family)